MNVQYLRALLADLPDDLLIGVAYPDHQNGLSFAYETLDVRSVRVAEPAENFAGVKRPALVLIVHDDASAGDQVRTEAPDDGNYMFEFRSANDPTWHRSPHPARPRAEAIALVERMNAAEMGAVIYRYVPWDGK